MYLLRLDALRSMTARRFELLVQQLLSSEAGSKRHEHGSPRRRNFYELSKSELYIYLCLELLATLAVHG